MAERKWPIGPEQPPIACSSDALLTFVTLLAGNQRDHLALLHGQTPQHVVQRQDRHQRVVTIDDR